MRRPPAILAEKRPYHNGFPHFIRATNRNKMKTPITSVSSYQVGELYLFHRSDAACPPESSLWGFYDKTEDGVISLEHSTTDLRHFKRWHELPDGYKFARLAERCELRDYMYSLGVWDAEVAAESFAVAASE